MVKKKEWYKQWWFYFVLGIIALFLLNNFTTQKVYDVVSCSYNENSCEFPEVEWNGVCTSLIENQCCEEIRSCGGTTDNQDVCSTQYCSGDGEACMPNYLVDGTFSCECVKVV